MNLTTDEMKELLISLQDMAIAIDEFVYCSDNVPNETRRCVRKTCEVLDKVIDSILESE